VDPAAEAFETLFAVLTPGAATAVSAAGSAPVCDAVFPLGSSGKSGCLLAAARAATESPLPSTPAFGADAAAETAAPAHASTAKGKDIVAADTGGTDAVPAVGPVPAAPPAPAADTKLVAEALAAFLPVTVPMAPAADVAEAESENEPADGEAAEEGFDLTDGAFGNERAATAGDAEAPQPFLPPAAGPESGSREARPTVFAGDQPTPAAETPAGFARQLPGRPAGRSGNSGSGNSTAGDAGVAVPVAPPLSGVGLRPTNFLPQRDLDRVAFDRLQTATGAAGEANTVPATDTFVAAGELGALPVSVPHTGPAAAAFASPPAAPIAREGMSPGVPPGAQLAEDTPGLAFRITVEPGLRTANSPRTEARAVAAAEVVDVSKAIAQDSEAIAATVMPARLEAEPNTRRPAERRAADPFPAAKAALDRRPAILAAPSGARPVDSGEAKNEADKNFLTSEGDGVAKRAASLGTVVANRDLAMYSRTLSSLPTHPASGTDGMAAGIGSAPQSLPADLPEPAPIQIVANSHRAVEAVMSAVDRAAGREQTSVTLDFAIGRESLAVRVELQDGEVRATFRTESPELRAALAHEWQQAAAGGDRTLKLAPAAFVSSERDPQSGQSGEGSFRQQERQAWADDAREQAQVRTLLSRRSEDSVLPERPAAAQRPAVSANSTRLNLFA
jgi:hypothetical protein